MSGVSDLVGHHGAADTCVVGPTNYTRLEKRPIDNQLTATVEQIELARLASWPGELVLRRHRHPWHPATRAD